MARKREVLPPEYPFFWTTLYIQRKWHMDIQTEGMKLDKGLIIIVVIMTRQQLRSIAATPHDVHVHLQSATSVSSWLPVFSCQSAAVSRFFEDAQEVFSSSSLPAFHWKTWHNAWCAGVVASSLTTWPNSACKEPLADYICNVWQTGPVGYVDIFDTVLPLHTQYLALAWHMEGL